MNYIKGKNMKLYYNNVVIGCATDCEISINHNMKSRIPKSNWRWSEFVEGPRTWSAKTSGYVAINAGFEPIGMASDTSSQPVTFYCKVGERTYTGKCLFASAKISSTTKGIVKYELGIKGNGELESSEKSLITTKEVSSVITGRTTKSLLYYEFHFNTYSGQVMIYGTDDVSGANAKAYGSWPSDSYGRYDSSTNINSSKYIVFTSEGIYKWSTTLNKFVKQ